MNKCHCEQPATWLLLAFPNDPGENIATATWATCDEHIAEAAKALMVNRRVAETDHHIVLRADEGPR